MPSHPHLVRALMIGVGLLLLPALASASPGGQRYRRAGHNRVVTYRSGGHAARRAVHAVSVNRVDRAHGRWDHGARRGHYRARWNRPVAAHGSWRVRGVRHGDGVATYRYPTHGYSTYRYPTYGYSTYAGHGSARAYRRAWRHNNRAVLTYVH